MRSISELIKFIFNLMGVMVLLWLLAGLPLALIWLFFDFDWGTYWTICFFGGLFSLFYLKTNKQE